MWPVVRKDESQAMSEKSVLSGNKEALICSFIL